MNKVMEALLNNMNKTNLERSENKLLDRIWKHQERWRELKAKIETLEAERIDLENLHPAELNVLKVIQCALHRE